MSNTDLVDEFHDIRPYNDGEVPQVMGRLMDDPELADTLLTMKFPRLSRYLGWALRPLIRRALHREFDAIRNVRDLQVLIGEEVEKMLAKSATPFTVSGLSELSADGVYLYISNHRDIAMDGVFVNLALYRAQRDSVRLAIGDNLLSKPYAADLLRVNRCFIVKRSVSGRREKLQALTTLSRYIRQSLLCDGVSVWIAQREGRAKDGKDRTETAVLKMLSLSREKGQGFAEAMATMPVVPVAISYMYDPCDLDKARELHQKQATGEYKKSPHEDLLSIYKGIVGYKGAVHLSFGTPIQGCEDDEIMAAEVDRQILSNYYLHPTNLIAWERLHGKDPRVDKLKATLDCNWQECEQVLLSRVVHQPEEVKNIFLAMYANPVQARFDLETTSGETVGETQ